MFSGEHYEGGEVISESIRTQAELPWALGAPGPARSKGRATRQVLQRSKILHTYIHTYIHKIIQKYKHDFLIDIIIIFFAQRWSLSTTRSTSRAASRKTTKCMWRTASPRSRPSRPCWMKGTPCGRSCAMPCSTSLSARRKLWRCDSVWQAARQWLWKKSVCMYVCM